MKGITLQDVFSKAWGDPIYRSFLDTDFYKFLMGQLIWSQPKWNGLEVTFEITIRTPWVKVRDFIPLEAIEEEYDNLTKVKLSPSERSFLGGIRVGHKNVFKNSYLDYLETVTIPKVKLIEEDNGDITIRFTGPWSSVTFAEIPAMYIISELYYYYMIKEAKLSKFEITAIYANMMSRLQDSVMMLREHPGIKLVEFGSRRRHSRMWQEYECHTLKNQVPGFVGTSNTLISSILGSADPKGTNAHELQMVLAAITPGDTDEEIIQSQYDLYKAWGNMYPEELMILLPDTYGSTQFFRNAPEWLAKANSGFRPDSKEPVEATLEYADWIRKYGGDPMSKLTIPSDGLDAPEMVRIDEALKGKIGRISNGCGTNLSNNCRRTWPRNDEYSKLFSQFSMVCKAVSVKRPDTGEEVATVKLSDNPDKGISHDPARLARFKEIFGEEGRVQQDVFV